MKTLRSLGLLAALSAAGCRETHQDLGADVTMAVDLDVTSDPGKGTPNAEIQSAGHLLSTTDASGHAHLNLQGMEGDVVGLTVKCPAGFESPASPLTVTVHRATGDTRAPHFDARCAPTLRTVVVGVRTERGPNLPVLYLGREVGRTDASGAALVALSVKPGEHVTLTLDTTPTGPGSRLVPAQPSLTFVARDVDDFVTLDQKFDVEKAAPKPSRRAPRPAGPTRI